MLFTRGFIHGRLFHGRLCSQEVLSAEHSIHGRFHPQAILFKGGSIHGRYHSLEALSFTEDSIHKRFYSLEDSIYGRLASHALEPGRIAAAYEYLDRWLA